MAEACVEVTRIRCDRCGYNDSAGMFPDAYAPEGRNVLKKNGWDLSNPSHLGYFQSAYAGAVCPSCGNFFELDFHPEKKYENDG